MCALSFVNVFWIIHCLISIKLRKVIGLSTHQQNGNSNGDNNVDNIANIVHSAENCEITTLFCNITVIQLRMHCTLKMPHQKKMSTFLLCTFFPVWVVKLWHGSACFLGYSKQIHNIMLRSSVRGLHLPNFCSKLLVYLSCICVDGSSERTFLGQSHFGCFIVLFFYCASEVCKNEHCALSCNRVKMLAQSQPHPPVILTKKFTKEKLHEKCYQNQNGIFIWQPMCNHSISVWLHIYRRSRSPAHAL